MNHETDPTILEDLKQAAGKSGLALRRLIDKVPFIDQGVLPFVFLLVLLPAAYYQTTALWGAVSSDVAIYTGKPVRATVMDAGVTGSRGSADAELNLHAGYRYSFDNRAFESTNSTSSFDFAGLGPTDWVRAHPKGSRIDVLVNPRNPEMSAIDPHPTFAQALVMLIAMPFTLFGLGGVLTERAQSKLHYEKIIGGWGVLTLVVFAFGHALTVATCVAIATYFVVWFVTNRYAQKKWVSDIEEDLNAPPVDVEDFRP